MSCLVRVLFTCCLLLTLPASELVQAGHAEDPVVITYACWGGPGDVANARRFATGFVEQHPDIAVRIAVYPWGQYWAKLQTQCASGLAPDVISLYSVAMGVWIDRGALAPLDGLVADSGIDLDDYHPTAVATCRWAEDDGSTLYAFPMEMAVRLLVYDQAKLEQAGIPRSQWPSATEPMSWDAYRALADRLTLRADDGSIIQYGAHYGYDWERSMLGIYGGTLYDRDTNPTRSSVADDRALQRALTEIYQQQYARRSMLGNIPLSSGLQTGADNAMISGRFAMGSTGSWALKGLRDAGIKVGMAPLPTGSRSGHRISVNALGIFSGSPHKQAAWAFIRYMGSQQVQPLFGSSLRGVPALNSAARSIVDNEFGIPGCEAFLAAADRARPLEVVANTDVPGAVERWFSSLETGLDELYDERFRALPRNDGVLAAAELDAFVAAMEASIAERIAERLPTLDADIDRAFERAARPQPGFVVAGLLPVIVLIVGALLLFLGLRFIASLQRERRGAGLQRPAAGWVALAPWLLGLVCFGIGPILTALLISFSEWNMIDSPRWVGLLNYLRLLDDERWWAGLGRTLGYAALVIPISLAGGLFTAALLTCDIRGRDAFKAILYLPSLFTGAAAAVLWVNMFNKEFGIVNRLIEAIGLAPVSWLDEGHAFFTVVLMNVFWIGGSMIIYYAGIKQIPKSLYEAAKVDGAGPLRSFFSITIPMLSPVILFLVVMSTIGAFQIFTPALFVANSSYAIGAPGDSLRFYSVNIYDEAFNNLRMGRACAQAIILFGIIFVITMLQLWASKRFVHTEAEA